MNTNERLALTKAISEQDDKVLIFEKFNHEFKLKKAKHKCKNRSIKVKL